MKKMIFSIIFLCSTSTAFSQSAGDILAWNEQLTLQLGKNNIARIASDMKFQKDFKEQKNIYNNVNKYVTQIIVIQDKIYKNLKNVNSALLQGKKLEYIYEYLKKIKTQATILAINAFNNPQYAALSYKYFNFINKNLAKIYQELSTQILSEDTNFLMDAYDREVLIQGLYIRLANIHSAMKIIIMRIKNGKKVPYIYQIPVLNNYINIDKTIIQQTMWKLKTKF